VAASAQTYPHPTRPWRPVLAEMESNGAIKIAGAMYSQETGVVDFFAG
jgi:hypothetical protein